MREDYVKAVLYIYPKLAAIAEDYGEHIRNRALGSYRRTAEREAEYLAEEILRKGAIENLKEKVDGILKKLSGEERFLLEMRYFGRRKQVSAVGLRPRSERSYYRRQEKLLGKMAALFAAAGLTEEAFFREYGGFAWMMSVCRRVGAGRECAAGRREQAWLAEWLVDAKSVRGGPSARGRGTAGEKGGSA